MPLFWPMLLVLLGFAGALAIPLGRLLAPARPVPVRALFLLGSLAVVGSVTLTPVRTRMSELLVGADCTLSPGPLPDWTDVAALTETGLNVWLFVPLGLACGLLPRGAQVAVAAAFSAGVPFAIEATQSALPSLGRICSGGDVAANLVGLAAGLAVSLVFLRTLFPPAYRERRSDHQWEPPAPANGVSDLRVWP
jgi:hypothetical protein